MLYLLAFSGLPKMMSPRAYDGRSLSESGSKNLKRRWHDAGVRPFCATCQPCDRHHLRNSSSNLLPKNIEVALLGAIFAGLLYELQRVTEFVEHHLQAQPAPLDSPRTTYQLLQQLKLTDPEGSAMRGAAAAGLMNLFGRRGVSKCAEPEMRL
jgi:hypothetical protein